MYEAWLKDPNSVHASWRAVFQNETRGIGKGASYTPPPALLGATSTVSSGRAASSDHVLVWLAKGGGGLGEGQTIS